MVKKLFKVCFSLIFFFVIFIGFNNTNISKIQAQTTCTRGGGGYSCDLGGQAACTNGDTCNYGFAGAVGGGGQYCCPFGTYYCGAGVGCTTYINCASCGGIPTQPPPQPTYQPPPTSIPSPIPVAATATPIPSPTLTQSNGATAIPTITPLCNPDTTGNSVNSVDDLDFAWWIAEFTGTKLTKNADCNTDQVIDIFDFNKLRDIRFFNGH